MAKEELITGLKNALARNESLEKAMQSLASAGYNPQEINEAVNYLNMGVSQIVPQPKEVQQKQTGMTIVNNEEQTSQNQELKSTSNFKALPKEQIQSTIQEKPKKKTWLITLIVILIILIIGLAAVIMFGDKILSSLFSK